MGAPKEEQHDTRAAANSIQTFTFGEQDEAEVQECKWTLEACVAAPQESLAWKMPGGKSVTFVLAFPCIEAAGGRNTFTCTMPREQATSI